MTTMMMINCFCVMFDRRKAFTLISSRDHCQRSSPSRISDTPRAGFEPVQNLSSGLVEWNCAVVITATPLHKVLLSVMFFQTTLEFLITYSRDFKCLCLIFWDSSGSMQKIIQKTKHFPEYLSCNASTGIN